MKSVKSFLRFFSFGIFSLLVIPPQLIVMLFSKGPASYTLPFIWENVMRSIFGIKIIVEGNLDTSRQLLYVGNHLSYFDIPVIGSLIKASFVARGDLAGWPVFGFLARLQQTLFISRSPKHAQEAKRQLDEKIAEGKSLIIFAEGTSTRGTTVLPFKSSLFNLAMDNGANKILPIQPFTISLAAVDGQKDLTDELRDMYAWHSDMTLWPHISAFSKLRGATVKVTFHDIRDTNLYDNRKTLAQDCFEDVAAGLDLKPL